MFYYEEALIHNIESCELHYNIAVTLQDMGKHAEAEKYYQRTIQIDPHHIQAWMNLSALHHKYGSLEDAIWLYTKSLYTFFFQLNRVDRLQTPKKRELKLGDFVLERNAINEIESRCVLMNSLQFLEASLSIYTESADVALCSNIYIVYFRNRGFTEKCQGPKAYSSIYWVDDEMNEDSVIFFVMLLNNKAQALYQIGREEEALRHHIAALFVLDGKVEKLLMSVSGKFYPEKSLSKLKLLHKRILETHSLIFRSIRSGCMWNLWTWSELLIDFVTREDSKGVDTKVRN